MLEFMEGLVAIGANYPTVRVRLHLPVRSVASEWQMQHNWQWFSLHRIKEFVDNYHKQKIECHTRCKWY